MLGGHCCRSTPFLVLPSPAKYIRWSSSHCLSPQAYSFRPPNSHGLHMVVARPRCQLQPTLALLAQLSLQELSDNQVLVAVLTASLIGQALKPVTAALQGKGFNWRLIIASGGIVMYDAQGVRRAVGKQAEVINTLVVGSDPEARINTYKQLAASKEQAELQSAEALGTRGLSSDQRRSSTTIATTTKDQPWRENRPVNDVLAKGGSYQRSPSFMETAKKLPSVEAGNVNVQEIGNLDGWRHIPLKESVGHTKLEVLVGGLWGIVCTLALSYLNVQL